MTDATTRTYVGTATSASEDGSVYVTLSQDVTLPDDDDGEHGLGVEMPTTVAVDEGDEVLVTVFGGGTMKSPVVTGNPGWGDSIQTQVDSVETLAQQAEAEVEQVRQDVADFRDDVATTYATKVEREDGDDAVKTWVTTNYTNSNDLATTYATKTLVSQTKDAIELAASQTYETQTDAAATYATKAALTVGLDGIRSEVAEDYQPKGDYATTASMNSAIQQSASSIESSVAATYETKSDAAATYATKTEVQQTASGLDTRITTAQSTADGAASTASTAAGNAATALSTANTANGNATAALSKVDGLQVGGTNLASDVKLWYTRTASSDFTARGITVKQLGDGLYSAIGTTTGNGDIWFQTTNIDAALSRDPGDYVMSAYVESGTWPSSNFYLQLAAYRLSNNTWNRNIRTANGSTSQAFTCTSDYPRHFGFYSNTSGVEVNITFRLKLERGNVPTDWSPAPEDMATEADLQAEVTERQTLIRQFSGGVLAGYVGNAIAALVNAAGSFDVVEVAWTDGVPSILSTLATFGANLIRIGGKFASSGRSTAKVQFFEDNSALTDLTAEHYIDTTTEPQVSHDLALSSTVTDDELPDGTSRTVTGNVEVWEQIYNDGTDYSDEVYVSLNGMTTNRTNTVSMGIQAIQGSSGSWQRTAFAVADTLRLTYGTGEQTSVNDIPLQQAIVGLTQPSGTYIGTNNTTTATSSGWRITWFNTRIAGTAGNFGENYYTFSNGVVTLLKACVLEFSGVMNWTDSVAGTRGFGIFKGSSTVSSGREWSAFQMFPSGTGTRKSVVLPPIMLPCTAGEQLAIGRYEQTNAVYVNGSNFSWITIRVVEDRSGGTGEMG